MPSKKKPWVCPVCVQAVGGQCGAFVCLGCDPPTYVHPGCGDYTKTELQARRKDVEWCQNLRCNKCKSDSETSLVAASPVIPVSVQRPIQVSVERDLFKTPPSPMFSSDEETDIESSHVENSMLSSDETDVQLKSHEGIPLDVAEMQAEGPSRADKSPSRCEESPSIAEESPWRAEGSLSKAEGSLSKAEGSRSKAEGSPSKAEGSPSKAEGSPSRAEGSPSRAEGSPSRAEGSPSRAEESPSRAEGSPLRAEGSPLRAEESPSRAEESPLRAEESPSRAEESPSRAEEGSENPLKIPELEGETFNLRHKNRNIFVGKRVPHEEGDMCHNKKIPEGHGKFIINTVYLKEAIDYGYDQETQSKGCFIIWPLSDCRLRLSKTYSNRNSASAAPVGESNPSSSGETDFYVDEGEGMMDGFAKTIEENDSKRGRKRLSKPDDWKSAKKRKYTQGSEGKKVGPPCECRLKCREKISEDQRQAIFEEYLDLKSIERRRDFHCRYVKNATVERGRVRTKLKSGARNTKAIEEGSRRTVTRQYLLGDVVVCKKMYLNTLNISVQTIDTAFQKQGSVTIIQRDRRGGNNKKHIEGRELIKKHIKRFPVKDSHYCRKHTNKRYLHERLSVVKMYKLYRKWMEQEGLKPELLHMYNQVFNEDFNLSFFKRKKDKCCLCNALENLKLDQRWKRLIFREDDIMKDMDLEELTKYDTRKINLLYDKDGKKEVLPERGCEEEFILEKYLDFNGTDVIDPDTDSEDEGEDESEDDDKEIDLTDMSPDDAFIKGRRHLHNVALTRKLKSESKKKADENEDTVYCCFDLQQVLECPFSNVGDMFYHRCLSSYNFVVNDTVDAYCFFWSEEHGNRGANEISTGLKLFAEEKAKNGVKHILGFADGCGGQGKNRMVAAIIDHIVQNTELESFAICYLEKGHTENSADDVHSLIERHKVSTVNVPDEWPTLFRQIDTKLNMKVTHLKHNDFLDVHDYLKGFSNFHKNTKGEKIINWKTVKSIRVIKSKPHVVFFKMAYNQSDYQEIDLIQVGGKRSVKRDASRIPSVIKRAYPTRLPIAAAKYEDLMDMCKSNVVPQEFHAYYKKLLV